MHIKKDTVEYNAEMFATKPNAFVEDQLKKLPGVEVDASGNITAQGETVTRVLVNGKRFFNDDPKLATRNIPPDIVERYQIFDDLDDQSKFTGIDDGNRVKTLNIVTKKDKTRRLFRPGHRRPSAPTRTMTKASTSTASTMTSRSPRSAKAMTSTNRILPSRISWALPAAGEAAAAAPAPRPTKAARGLLPYGPAEPTTTTTGAPNIEAYGSYFYNFTHVTSDQQSLTDKIHPDPPRTVRTLRPIPHRLSPGP